MKVEDIESFKLKLASPDEILEWSHGEVTEAETLNYRTQKPEKDGLFCERIFGPSKDYQCYCGKYKGARYKGVVCDRCGVEVTKSSVRRKRMGHIDLAAPVSHIWFLKGVPSKMGAVLNISARKLEKVVYFANYIITEVDDEVKEETEEKIEREYESKVKALKSGLEKSDEDDQQDDQQLTEEEFKEKKKELKEARDEALDDLNDLTELRILSEVDYYHLSLKYGEVFEAGTGAEALKKLFEKVDLDQEIKEVKEHIEEKSGSTKKLERRLQILQGMKDADIKPEWMFLEVLPVTPPGIRPLVQLDGGRFASSDLNDLYRRVINRNSRLKHLLDIGAPQVIVRNEKRMLQEAVDALIDNGMRKRRMVRSSTGGRRALKSLSDVLSGKQGRFRRNLLGKRVDYSGRSVIAVDPTLKLSQCGLPKELGLELFKPFIIQRLLDKEEAYNVRGATEHIEKKSDEAWEALEEVVQEKVVLLNRAPTLHRLGIQAFHPILVEGKAIRIHPMVCPAYNADFDGDQMAIHIPLTDEAQQEAKERMLSSKNVLKPATGLPIAVPTQDYILGSYFLTTAKEGLKGEGQAFSSTKQAKLAYEFDKIDLRAKIKVRVENMNIENLKQLDDVDNLIETTVGRLYFNEVLPEEFPYQNKQINSGVMNSIISKVLENYDVEQEVFLDSIKDLGKEYSTWSGVTWGINDLKQPEEKQEIIEKGMEKEKEIDQQLEQGLLTQEERREQLIEIWQQVKSEVEEVVPKALAKDNPVYEMVDSGSRGSWGPVVQMMGMKGLVVNPAGEIIELPVRSSFKEGFDVLEYFISTHGSRKGAADGALRTAKAGYLTRRLVDVAQQVIVEEDDCGTDQGLTIKKKDAQEVNQDFKLKITGRFSLDKVEDEDGVIVEKGEMINWEKAARITNSKVEQVEVRSPLTCNSKRGVCRKCYGWHPGDNEMVELGAAVGIVAAQAIGEPGTQLTLRTFHSGGVAGESDITSGLPRAEEIFEVRDPKGEAPLSKVDGKVVKVEEDKVQVEPDDTEAEVVEYDLPPNRAVWVEEDEKIEAGDQLCEGNLNLKELFEVTDKKKTWHYILKELQKVYSGQGANIHDKHMEVILKQMLSRVKITDPHDSSNFVTGEVIEKAQWLEEKARLEEQGKTGPEVEHILQGISKVSLSTESLLSAASFQRTSQVLIDAAIRGEKDELRGLKENVMIGKKIPAGTGYEDSNK